MEQGGKTTQWTIGSIGCLLVICFLWFWEKWILGVQLVITHLPFSWCKFKLTTELEKCL